MVLARIRRMDLLAIKRAFLIVNLLVAGRRQTVDLGDF
jgi:hypothetical protein